MYSYTYNNTNTFTLTHAKYLASKVAADLKRIQRFHNKPSDKQIEDYEIEITELLKNGYLDSVTYGFIKDYMWIEPTLIYKSDELSAGIDNDPGRITFNPDAIGTSFYSFLIYSEKWSNLNEVERDKFKKKLPINRSTGDEPKINGYLTQDKIYTSGGQSLNRSIVKKYY